MPRQNVSTMKKSEVSQIIKLSDKPDETYIESGIKQIDALLGGGFYRGRITEISGNEGMGKTYLATKLMANLSKDYKVLFIDSEFSLNKERVIALGADPENISYVADARLERMAELMTNSVGTVDVIILDSLASLVPMTIEMQEVGSSANIGLYARLVKQWVMKMRPKLGTSQTAFIAINQMRKPLGFMATIELPGGKSWAHSCDVRLRLSSNVSDKKANGRTIHAETTKNKMAIPFVKTSFFLEY